MNEVLSFESYIEFKPKRFERTLERLKIILNKLGLWNDELKKSFNQFITDSVDGDFEYVMTENTDFYKSELFPFLIKPLALCFKSTASGEEKYWLCLELLIAKSTVFNSNLNAYTDFKSVNHIAKECFKEFREYGVYLTDDNQHGKSFDALEISDFESFWNFEYALIDGKMFEKLNSKPAEYSINKFDDFIEIYKA